uniref:BRO1 domain-containing protein n=1 Tax=Panagrolaimus superbus TaxID=310955 RepID=A0A914YPZ6_9BILA
MSHWFHRNPLKATEFAKFDLKHVLKNEHSSKICGELRLRRDKFLKHLESASSDLEQVETEFNQYLSLLYGFLFDITADGDKESKLRYLLRPTWGNSMIEKDGIVLSDSWFEALNMCYNMALWYMKHGAWVSAKDEVKDSEAKTAHCCLKKAAGLFEFIKEKTDLLCGLDDFPGNDFNMNVIKSYLNQSVAEAQEIAIARAIELQHSPSLISKLATETARIYHEIDTLLEKFNPSTFEKWRCYAQLKNKFYLSYAYCYRGEALLAEDKCGEAVRSCKEGIKCYKEAEEICVKYAKSSGPGFIAKPEKHLFFRRIQPLLERHLEKAERENGFIYHQIIPDALPSLEENASFGLAKPEAFVYPKKSDAWTLTAYDAFDISKADTPDFSKAKKSKKSLPTVKEEKVYQTDRDPKNVSGCSVM